MKDKLKILFVIPVPGKHQYISFGIGYLSSYIKKYADKKIIIKLADENAGDDILKIFLKEKPDIVGITASTPQIPRAEKIAAEMKRLKKDCFIVFGGIHASIMPEQTLCDCSAIDLIVIGEGEETLKELSDLWLKKNGKILHELDSIPGLAFRRNGGIYKTKSRELISEIDKIPPPDREIFNEEYYLSPRQLIRGFSARRSTSILTSRGCPYSCKFCASNLMAKKYRAHSVGYIMEEIKNLVEKYKIESLYFHDDLFIANKKRVFDFCDEFIKAGYHKKIIWCCQVRAELINKESILLLEKMKEAGCKQLEFGFESGSNRVLKFLKGDTASVIQNQVAIDTVKKVGLRIFGNFMIGSITETKREIEMTKKFIKKNNNKIDFFQTYITVPYPGTSIWEMCKERKLIQEGEKFENFFLFNGDNISRSFCDTAPLGYLEKTVMELNRMALDKIPLKEKILWATNFILKDPKQVFLRACSYLKGF